MSTSFFLFIVVSRMIWKSCNTQEDGPITCFDCYFCSWLSVETVSLSSFRTFAQSRKFLLVTTFLDCVGFESFTTNILLSDPSLSPCKVNQR